MQVELYEIPSPGAFKGEAIVCYCKSLITQQMEASGLCKVQIEFITNNIVCKVIHIVTVSLGTALLKRRRQYPVINGQLSVVRHQLQRTKDKEQRTVVDGQ